MKKQNIVFIARSIDGYIAGKDGALDWLDLVPNPDKVEMGYTPLMEEIDAIVMGRNTYETVCGFGIEWPYAKPVFVLSHTLQSVPEPLQGKVHLLNGTPAEVLAHLYAQGYFSLYIDGGKTIQDFLKADLIDELRITTIPILLGGGAFLFGDLERPLEFEHVETQVFLNQLVQNTYRRKREAV